MDETPIERVAVVATGVIGASWAALFLARGLEVTATDPAPGAEGTLRRAVAAHWPVLEEMGLTPGASPDRLRFVASPEAAVEEAKFVQENGPERLDLKQELFRRLDAVALPDAILASSSSTLRMSEVQALCARHPGRVLLGHPFNPPHLIPLVEVAGGEATDEAAIARAMAFSRRLGKRPIRLRREVTGHVANRLQAALWQEAFHLVKAGVASVEDVDTAISHGPGLRWALLGPFLNLELSGGTGGLGELFHKPLWAATEGMWRELGAVSVDAKLAGEVVQGIGEELAGKDPRTLSLVRDAALLRLLRLKAETEGLP